jgi:hypothetical protein
MPSLKIPLGISAILVLGGCALLWWLFHSQQTDAEQKFNASVAMLACVGGLVSAVFVVFAYYQTAWTMVEASRPQLLIQVVNEKRQLQGPPAEPVPVTVVHYTNTTGNQFEDLAVHLTVQVGQGRRIELKDLFRNALVMPGHDRRHRWFESKKVLSDHGVDVDSESAKGTTIVVEPGYSYSFRGESQTVRSQRYRWNPQLEQWEIW